MSRGYVHDTTLTRTKEENMTTHAATHPGQHSFLGTALKWTALGVLGATLLYTKTIGLLMKGAIKAIKARPASDR
jgi:hypothetical protein